MLKLFCQMVQVIHLEISSVLRAKERAFSENAIFNPLKRLKAMTRVYVTAPVNLPGFCETRLRISGIAEELREKGFEVETCFDVCGSGSLTCPSDEPQGKRALAEGVFATLSADMIFLCYGWQKSRRCVAEMMVASQFGKKMMTEMGSY